MASVRVAMTASGVCESMGTQDEDERRAPR
jgi:hypothetical protein